MVDRIKTDDITLQLPDVKLKAFLSVPENPRGAVLFAHGSGSSRHSPRNQYIAKVFQNVGFCTLLMDLLTPDEEKTDIIDRKHRFNIPLLAHRLAEATDWFVQQDAYKNFPVGYFGASTGAAAALIAAAQRSAIVKAVVSRGGRPDLAGQFLPKVQCPTLFIVGGNDHGVIELNEDAFNMLRCEKHFEIVPGATHLFEESGKLEEVAMLTKEFFDHHLL